MKTDELEVVIARMLARLPDPVAPPTLLPRVMDAVRSAANQPWHARPWSEWPGWAKVAAAVASAVPLALAATAPSPVDLVDGPLVESVRVLWHAVVEPNAVYLAVLAGAMGAASVLFCAALSRILSLGSPE